VAGGDDCAGGGAGCAGAGSAAGLELCGSTSTVRGPFVSSFTATRRRLGAGWLSVVAAGSGTSSTGGLVWVTAVGPERSPLLPAM